MIKISLFIIILLILSSIVLASGGRTNASGCHNSKIEGYHCHTSSIIHTAPSVITNNVPQQNNQQLIIKNQTGNHCILNSDCISNYCIHNICRNNSYYIGDSSCDKGEDCINSPKDCGSCKNNNVCNINLNETCLNSNDCKCKTNQVCDINRSGTRKNGCYDIKCGDNIIDFGETPQTCCIDTKCPQLNSFFKENVCSPYSNQCFIKRKSWINWSIFFIVILIIAVIITLKKSYKGGKMTKYKIIETIFKKCPVCKKGQVDLLEPKGFFGVLFGNKKIECNKCNSIFTYEGDKAGEEAYTLDLSKSESENKYDGQLLKKSEWERGKSDLDYCIEKDLLPKFVGEINIILEPKEIPHYSTYATLMEARAVRRNVGGAVRVTKGVYVGGSQGESHDELRKIDRGLLFLTNKRIIFNGDLRNAEYRLYKINSVEEYEDCIEVGLSNRQKLQTLVVNEPHKWNVFIKMAIRKFKK